MDELFVIKRIAVYMYIKVRSYIYLYNNNMFMYININLCICILRLWDSYLSEITEGFENFHVYVCAGKFICMCIS